MLPKGKEVSDFFKGIRVNSHILLNVPVGKWPDRYILEWKALQKGKVVKSTNIGKGVYKVRLKCVATGQEFKSIKDCKNEMGFYDIQIRKLIDEGKFIRLNERHYG